MAKLAVLILAGNEKMHIGDCVKSAKFADEVIVIHSGGSDGTAEIAENCGAKVVYHPMTEGFAAQRNFALTATDAEWVMFLDADERISGELAAEIGVHINTGCSGYKMPRCNIFLGRWIRGCGWYPDYCLRLFKREQAKYTGLVHEKVHIIGEIGILKNALQHFSYRNIEHYMNKLNKYTSLAAEQMSEDGRKAAFTDITLRPVFTFIKMYILKRGFQDGVPGLIVSILSSVYVFIKYLKLYYRNKGNGHENFTY